MPSLKVELSAKNKTREIFLREIKVVTIAFTREIMTLDAMFKEIAKNIYDHNYGNGYLILNKIGKYVEFEIGNRATSLSAAASRPVTGERINFGDGLRSIPQIAMSLGIKLKIDIPGGYIYSGTYQIK